MSLDSRTSTLLLVDCSASMGREHLFEVGEGDAKTSRMRTGLDVAKEYVKSKLVARIIRDLKTTPIGVILFGHSKTKNLLTTRAKENAAEREEKFDRANDPYRHCYELIPLRKELDKSLLDQVDLAGAGEGPDGDAFTATILGVETLEGQPTFAKYSTKELYVLTDGESEINWDGLDKAAGQMNARGIGLTVVGIDFDDEEIGFVEENKSEIKRTNEAHFRDLVDQLEQPSLVVNARQALNAILTPRIQNTNSRPDRMSLKLGDTSAHPDSSLTMWVDVKKAVVPAAPMTMKQMSMRGFERTRAQTGQSQSQSQSQGAFGTKRKADDGEVGDADSDEDDAAKAAIKAQKRFEERKARELRAHLNAGQGLDLSKLGVTFDKTLQNAGLAIGTDEDADLASHGVVRETLRFYRPPDLPNNGGSSSKDREDREMDDAEREERRAKRWRPVDESASLTPAYFYGGTLVPVGDLEDDVGTLKGNETGMEIVHFMKEGDLRYDFRMGDVFYVHAARGNTGSEKLFSALVNAMYERQSVAIVRFVKKGGTRDGKFRLPDPMLGVLCPAIDEQGLEYCYWVRMPFAEDVRALEFPSLERLFERSGRRIFKHKYLPTDEMHDAMDSFVDSMDLMKAGPPDENGEPTEFFHVEDSYSPAIHNIQNTLVFRMCNPDGTLPPPPPALTRYMDPPVALADRAEDAAKRVKEVCDVKIVPPKLKKINKRTQKFANPGEDDTISYEALFGAANASKFDQSKAGTAPSVDEATFKKSLPVAASATVSQRPAASAEADDDELMIIDSTKVEDVQGNIDRPPIAPAEEFDQDDAEPDTEEEPDTEDDEMPAAPSSATPVRITAKLDEAHELVKKSFSWGSYGAAQEAILAARKAAEQTGDALTYNAGLKNMVEALRGNPKKHDFLGRMKDAGLTLLVGSAATEDEARAFLASLA